MGFEQPNFSQESNINTTQEGLNNKLEKELYGALNKELSEKEAKLQGETKEKKDKLNREYITYTLGKYITLSSISLGNDISYSLEGKEITINNETHKLPIKLTNNEVIEGVEKYLQQDYFQENFNKNNIVEYTLEQLNGENFTAEEIKQLSKNSSELLNYLESKLGGNIRAIISLLGEDFIQDLGIGIQALGYSQTGDKDFLDTKGGFEDGVQGLVGEKYSKNFENANPLLKTAVIGGGGIYAAFKLFSWVSEKMKGNWLKVIFGGLAVELIGQVVSGKSITGETLNKVGEMFQGSDNSKELKKQISLLEKNNEKIELGEYRALTHLIIGKSDIKGNLNISEIKKNANKEMVEFFCSQNNISEDKLYENILTGHQNILKDIHSETGIDVTQLDFSKITFNSSESNYSEKVLTLQMRSNDIGEKIKEIKDQGVSEKTIKKTYDKKFDEYLKLGNKNTLDEIQI